MTYGKNHASRGVLIFFQKKYLYMTSDYFNVSINQTYFVLHNTT